MKTVPIEVGLGFIRKTHAKMVEAADPLKEQATSEQGGAK